MRAFIEELNSEFVLNFMNEALLGYFDVKLITLRKQPYAYEINFSAGLKKYKIVLTSFYARCTDKPMADSLTRKWRSELKEQFGDEYTASLKKFLFNTTSKVNKTLVTKFVKKTFQTNTFAIKDNDDHFIVSVMVGSEKCEIKLTEKCAECSNKNLETAINRLWKQELATATKNANAKKQSNSLSK